MKDEMSDDGGARDEVDPHPPGDEEAGQPTASLGDLMEYSLPRLALEVTIGATAGAVLGYLLAPEAPRTGLFALAGAILAPIALLLTPTAGSVTYRAVRYGGALALLGTLAISFVAGIGGVDVAELVAVGVLLFAVGSIGHAVLIRSLPGWT